MVWAISTVFTGTKGRFRDKITGSMRKGIVQEPNKIWVGEAHRTKDKFECMEKCAADEKCKSATFNGKDSVNPYVCVLAYGEPSQKFQLTYNSDLATAPRCCHCSCDSD